MATISTCLIRLNSTIFLKICCIKISFNFSYKRKEILSETLTSINMISFNNTDKNMNFEREINFKLN